MSAVEAMEVGMGMGMVGIGTAGPGAETGGCDGAVALCGVDAGMG